MVTTEQKYNRCAVQLAERGMDECSTTPRLSSPETSDTAGWTTGHPDDLGVDQNTPQDPAVERILNDLIEP